MKNSIETHYKISLNELNISIKDIEKLAHIDEGMPSYSDFLNSELDQLNDKTTIEGGYVIVSGLTDNENVMVNGKVFKVGNQVALFFKHMTDVAIFVCSAGKEVAERAEQLTRQGELVEGYLVDVLGSVMVEKAMDVVQGILQDEMKKQGLCISNRYSPGYCDWDVKEQQQLFSFFTENFCHVTLSDSCLMTPIKSVSGMIAIGEKVRFHNHVCHACSSVNCLYRNTGTEA